jgi:hypothetical protein
MLVYGRFIEQTQRANVLTRNSADASAGTCLESSIREARAALLAAMVLWAAGCDLVDSPSTICLTQANESGEGFTVAGAFPTTVGRVRTAMPASAELLPAEFSDEDEAVLCYLVGEIPGAATGKRRHPAKLQPSGDCQRGGLCGMGVRGLQDRLPVSDPNRKGLAREAALARWSARTSHEGAGALRFRDQSRAWEREWRARALLVRTHSR